MAKKKILERMVFENENTNVFGEPGKLVATAGKFLKAGTLVVPTTDVDIVGGPLYVAVDRISPNEGFSGTVKLASIPISQELPAGYMPGDSISPGTLNTVLVAENSGSQYGFFVSLGTYGSVTPSEWGNYTITGLYANTLGDSIILNLGGEKIVDSILGAADTITMVCNDIGAPLPLDLIWNVGGGYYTATSNSWTLFISAELPPPRNLILLPSFVV